MPSLIKAETRWPAPVRAVLTARRSLCCRKLHFVGEAAGNSTGGGGAVGGYQPGKVGNLHERFASALGLAVEVVEEGGFCGVGEEVGICQGFDAFFLGISI